MGLMPADTKPKRNHADYNDLLDISEGLIHTGLDRIYLHLRDARELMRLAENSVIAKATIVLASAALESNLAHLTLRAQEFGKARPGLYSPEQSDYLAGKQTIVTDRGAPKEIPQRQSLEESLSSSALVRVILPPARNGKLGFKGIDTWIARSSFYASSVLPPMRAPLFKPTKR
jgi:hypothetical protein